MTRRTRLLVILMAVLLALAATWTHRRWVAKRRAAATAQADVRTCRRLAERIKGLSRAPILAVDRERLASETTSLIEDAARKAGINAAGLRRITPEPASRVGDTVYKAKPTRVVLREVSRRQVTDLIHGLIATDTGLRAASIRLTAPTTDDVRDIWNAELVFTYLIYDPPKSDT